MPVNVSNILVVDRYFLLLYSVCALTAVAFDWFDRNGGCCQSEQVKDQLAEFNL